MRRLVVSAWMTLDGVFDADTMGQWVMPYDSDDRQQWIKEAILASDAFLFGRITYEMLAGYWPTVKDCDSKEIEIAEGTVAPNDRISFRPNRESERHCKRWQNGAISTEPQDQPYGERQYNAEDFCGHRWDFTETIADIAPEELSGGAFHLE